MKGSFLTANIVLLSVISLFTDVASEMLYPIIPLYLSSLGYSPAVLGTIEGAAETASGLIKVYFGVLSDKLRKRTPFIKIGYGLSALSKPLIGIIASPFTLFGARFADRIGKGIRTAPRDAMIISESSPENRGKAFGFHRGMDSFGATLGPIVSLVMLYFIPENYRLIFIVAVIPGIVSFTLAHFLKERVGKEIPDRILNEDIPTPAQVSGLRHFRTFWKISDPLYKKLVLGFFLMAILNSSNMFLILRAREQGISDAFILIAYILYNLIFASFSYPIGKWLDKYGSRTFYIAGIMIFSLVYALFGQDFGSALALIGLFLLYGLFSAVDENISKTWLSLSIPSQYRATGIGLHLSVNALGFFIGSVSFGFLWTFAGAPIAFGVISLLALPVALYFYLLKKQTSVNI
ncbi:MAG: MFS transporter [Patescibacteria group bacterium]